MNLLPYKQRVQAGKSLRRTVPRSSHGEWTPRGDRRDPIEVLECSNRGRLSQLTPIRYARMLRNPFAFLRGSPAVMAQDLAETPATGLEVQACGDCHLVNFGLFATPERNLVFDINDFDETLRATWEWDLKRLTASFVVAARLNGFPEHRCSDIAVECARSYREHLIEFSTMSPLDVWYFHINADDLVERASDKNSRRLREQMSIKARSRIGERLFPKITEAVGSRHRFVENPPITLRVPDGTHQRIIRQGLADYRNSLDEARRFMLDRYRLEDFAMRVVGIGSVGTRCFVALLICDDGNPLLLQIKEARQSVLEPFAAKGAFQNQGQRVVVGQRMMQATSDILLGWLRARDNHDYYVRQLRDMKFSIPVENLGSCSLERYAEICGWALARAHAKSGDSASISGYLGRGDRFDLAVAQFAVGYADQTEQDHASLQRAHQSGRIEVHDEIE